MVREVMGVLGRLSFAASALTNEKPFLGPVYTWVSALKELECASIPWSIRLILRWFQKRLQEGGRQQEAPNIFVEEQGDLFRSDAKAEDGKAFIGGWECKGDTPTKAARWYALEVKEKEFPWAFAKGHDPGRVIAALELLGTIVSIIYFCEPQSATTKVSFKMTGATDNQGNSLAMIKMMSTKWPLTALIMEMSEQLRKRNAELHLRWVRRTENQEADDLTNGNFERFDMHNRIHINAAEIPWEVLGWVMAASQEIYEKVVRERLHASGKHASGKRGAAVERSSRRRTSAAKRLRATRPW